MHCTKMKFSTKDFYTLTMTIKLPDIISGSIMLQNILSVRVLEWIVILIGCEIKGINELDETDSKN